jgi:hypothetical protein
LASTIEQLATAQPPKSTANFLALEAAGVRRVEQAIDVCPKVSFNPVAPLVALMLCRLTQSNTAALKGYLESAPSRISRPGSL